MSDRNIRKRGRLFWYRIRRNGKTHEGSLETDNKALARERVAKKLAELKGRRWGEKPLRTFSEAAKRFEEEHFKALKPNTRRRYSASITHLLEHFGHKTYLADISSETLNAFEQKRRKGGAASPTIRGDFAALSSIWSCAEEWEWIDKPNPVKPYVRGRSRRGGLKEGTPRTRYLSHEEEKEVLAHAPPKARQAIVIAIETGLRKEEQFSMLWTDVDLMAREARVRAEVAKSGKRREVPLFERAIAVFRELPRSNRSPYVFVPMGDGLRYSENSPTMYEALQKAVRRANQARKMRGEQPMEHVEWHDLRRTCGCRLLQDKGFTLEEVRRWMGHSSVRVTEQHYAFLEAEHLHRRRREAEKGGRG